MHDAKADPSAAQVPLYQNPEMVEGPNDLRAPTQLNRGFELGLTGLTSEDGEVLSRFFNTQTAEMWEIRQSREYRNIMFWVPLDNSALPEGIASIQPTTSAANAINLHTRGIQEADPIILEQGGVITASWSITRKVRESPKMEKRSLPVRLLLLISLFAGIIGGTFFVFPCGGCVLLVFMLMGLVLPDDFSHGKGTTFSTELSDCEPLSDPLGGLESLMHRPIGDRSPELRSVFVINDYSGVSLNAELGTLPARFTSGFGNIDIAFDQKERAILLVAEGNDERRVALGLDMLGAKIELDAQGKVKDLILCRLGMSANLTRSTFSIILEKSGFSRRYPRIFALLKEKFVLEDVTEGLLLRESLAYREIPLVTIDTLIHSAAPEAVAEVLKLRQSKSQEIRRLGSGYLGLLREQRLISDVEYQREKEGNFVEDVKEDLVFIERTLRNDEMFVQETFRNLFGKDVTEEELIGSTVIVRYFARGCNKQIYSVEWKLPSGELVTFAISVIRDAMLGQGDFGEAEINESVQNWQVLCRKKYKGVARYGSSVWHVEWRNRYLSTHKSTCPVLSLLANNMFLVSREIVRDAEPLHVLLRSNCLEKEKMRALEAAARAYWGVWAVTRDAQGKGMFFRTPRAEDIVMKRGSSGRYTAKIIDMDTLNREVSEDGGFNYFGRYRYYPPDLVKRAFAYATRAGPGNATKHSPITYDSAKDRGQKFSPTGEIEVDLSREIPGIKGLTLAQSANLAERLPGVRWLCIPRPAAALY